MTAIFFKYNNNKCRQKTSFNSPCEYTFRHIILYCKTYFYRRKFILLLLLTTICNAFSYYIFLTYIFFMFLNTYHHNVHTQHNFLPFAFIFIHILGLLFMHICANIEYLIYASQNLESEIILFLLFLSIVVAHTYHFCEWFGNILTY